MILRLVLIAYILFSAGIAIGQDAAENKIDFATQIQPLLSDRCYFCHGPDKNQRKAGLRLDDEKAAKEFAIAPGDPEDSELLTRMLSHDPGEMMPPAKSKLPQFTSEEIELFRTWIEQGAEWGKHWAFVTPQPTQPPRAGDVFPRFDKSWVRNPIDAFVLKRLESEGISPSAMASRDTLLRRLSFDITGLPPTLEELQAFRDADEFESALAANVDRLLASPHYGERMASDWLDVSRYSDTYGYQVDRDRRVWPWRDWVIKAFNDNKPYDEFAIEQLAGDLLPNATSDQILATAFNRLHPQKVEGGSVEEEFRLEYVADRTQTFSTAFLGLTMECARCHDHKYDPLSQKEYYQLSAFFDNVDEAGLYSFFTGSTPTPTLDLPNEQQRAASDAAQANVNKVLNELADFKQSPEFKKEFDEWFKTFDGVVEPQPVLHEAFEGENGQLGGANQSTSGKVGNAVQLTGDDAFNTSLGNFQRHQPFSISFWLNPPQQLDRAVVLHRSRAWTDAASRGYQVLIEDGKISWSLIHFWPGNALRVKTNQRIPVNEWTHITVTYDGTSAAAGARIYVNGREAEVKIVRDQLTREITGGGGDNIAIGERFRDFGFKDGKVDELRVFDFQLSALEASGIHAKESESGEPAPLEMKLDPLLAYEHYWSRVSESGRRLLDELTAARKAYNDSRKGISQIMVMRETDAPRKTYLLSRGAYDQPTDEVQPTTPAALGELGRDLEKNRLGLAKWLVAPSNPLTARVYVNRVWQLMMGQGLVRTPEDFGVQGQAPSHPELLDWLAVDFMKNGWDIKRLIRQIAMSSTYLQSSTHRNALLERDPENRLLARGPRHRLSAEMLRDNVLSVSGLLSRRLGGPPTKPYEVEVSFKPVARDKGEGLYRRSLYTYWKRTGPAPVMMTLDAAKRDVCRVKRERTSSPLQAFVLMNSPQFVESARGLAETLVARHGADNAVVISQMFEILTSRKIDKSELAVLQELYEQQVETFQANPGDAKKYLEIGDKPAENAASIRAAALTVVANTLLGFHETVMKR